VATRDWLPKLSDHTLSADFSQYNHLLIASARNFAMIGMRRQPGFSLISFRLSRALASGERQPAA
jgi:hypothetical protein